MHDAHVDVLAACDVQAGHQAPTVAAVLGVLRAVVDHLRVGDREHQEQFVYTIERYELAARTAWRMVKPAHGSVARVNLNGAGTDPRS